MARGRTKDDSTMLRMALIGYELERQRIDEKIAELRAAVSGRGPSSGPKKTGRKRELSAGARKRISAAQKKRWAEHRKLQAQEAKSS